MPKTKSRKRTSRRYIESVAKKVVMRTLETKKYNMSADFASDAAGDQLLNLTEDIAQGDSDSTRDGDKILVTKLLLRVFTAMTDNQVTGASQFYRCMVVQTRGKQLTAADLPSLYGSADTDKFYVLYDKVWNISSSIFDATNTKYYGTTGTFSRTIKLKFKRPINIHYDDATPGYQNHLYLYILPYNEDARSKTAYMVNTYFKDP